MEGYFDAALAFFVVDGIVSENVGLHFEVGLFRVVEVENHEVDGMLAMERLFKRLLVLQLLVAAIDEQLISELDGLGVEFRAELALVEAFVPIVVFEESIGAEIVQNAARGA